MLILLLLLILQVLQMLLIRVPQNQRRLAHQQDRWQNKSRDTQILVLYPLIHQNLSKLLQISNIILVTKHNLHTHIITSLIFQREMVIVNHLIIIILLLNGDQNNNMSQILLFQNFITGNQNDNIFQGFINLLLLGDHNRRILLNLLFLIHFMHMFRTNKNPNNTGFLNFCKFLFRIWIMRAMILNGMQTLVALDT
jgi:hypothetical protein